VEKRKDAVVLNAEIGHIRDNSSVISEIKDMSLLGAQKEVISIIAESLIGHSPRITKA
jgi:hypothetical protein